MKANQGILSSFVAKAIFILGPCFWLNWKTHEVITQFLAEVFCRSKNDISICRSHNISKIDLGGYRVLKIERRNEWLIYICVKTQFLLNEAPYCDSGDDSRWRRIYKRMTSFVFLIFKLSVWILPKCTQFVPLAIFYSRGQKSNSGLGHLVVEVSRSNTFRHTGTHTQTHGCFDNYKM